MFAAVALPKIGQKEKVEVIPWNEFFRKHQVCDVEKKTIGGVSAAILATELFQNVTTAHAAEAVDVSGRIINGFQPLIELALGLAYPVAFLGFSLGFLLMMLGQRHKALQFVKWSAVGYIGMQFVPGMMKILVEVGKSVAAGV